MGDLHGLGGKARPRLITAALTSALLSALFLVVYGGTNWLTTLRSDVGMWYFEWERLIPFVPLMIIPYMSIDLFFVAAPFLCHDQAELRAFTRRTAFAILAAGACFLLMPLQLAWERPQAEGWLGVVFSVFVGMDQPHNLFPSLHIALRTILADIYARHTRGGVRLSVHVWFSLIGLSTVLTKQHHVIDVVGGFMLAGFCFYVFPETPFRLPVVKNWRIGFYYGLGAAVILAWAVFTLPWGSLLIWPAAALAIVAAAYFGLGPGVYRKTQGHLPLATRFVLAPVLVGQYASLLYYRRQCRAWDEVTPNVWIGRQLNDTEAAEAVRQGVTTVLDLTAEFSEATPFLATRYRHLPILDLTAPTQDYLREAADFITAEAAKGKVYVHCKIGYSRSAAAVGAYLLASGQTPTAEEAVDLLRRARPSIVVRPESLNALRGFERATAGRG